MVPRRLSPWTVALLVVIGFRAPAALAAPINFTGYVTQDFNPATNPNVTVTPVSSNALNIGQQPWETANGWVSGWSIQDIRTYYNSSNDTLYVGINTFANAKGQYAPFGQANGDPTGTPTSYDPANLGGDKSIALAFAPVSSTSPSTPGTPVVVAGVPADKSLVGKGTDGFTVSTYNAASAASAGLGYSFGTQLPQYTGNLAFNPSPSHPQLEFTISNFSKIPGLNSSNGFWISAYAGSAVDGVGEAYLAWTKIPANAQQNIPEPATWLAWSLTTGLAAWRFRNRRNRVRD
jgi:hypothetical protein